MALSLTMKWQLVACALVAHADGVLDGDECDRLMAMVDGEADGDEYSAWLVIVADPQRLQEILGILAPPPAEAHRRILGHTWQMSIIDGQRCEAEERVIREISQRLGVEAVQLDFWREAWSSAEHETATSIAQALGWVLGSEMETAGFDAKSIRSVVLALPTTQEHREALVRLAGQAHARDEVVRALSSLTPRKRRWALARIGPALGTAPHPSDAARRFIDLASELGIRASEAEALLHERA